MELKFTTAGNYPSNELSISPECSCGSIEDGVGFSFANHGSWVLSFKDLERIYREAKNRRNAAVERDK